MDLSEKIRENEEVLRPLKEKQKEYEVMERYSGADKVVPHTEILDWIRLASEGAPERVVTKIPRLDSMLDGFRPGQLIVLSAPTGNGKTAFLQHLTREFQGQANCLWFNYEMGMQEFVERFGDEVPAFFAPKSNRESNLAWLKARIVEGVAKYNTRIVFIDHLHFILDMKMMFQLRNTSLAIGALMREIKKIAIEHELIIFLVSHLSKTKLEDVPQIDDLRDSSFVGQESDIVLIMWQVMEKDKQNRKLLIPTNDAIVLVAKNRRNGRRGYVKCRFDRGRFTEIANIEEPNA